MINWFKKRQRGVKWAQSCAFVLSKHPTNGAHLERLTRVRSPGISTPVIPVAPHRLKQLMRSAPPAVTSRTSTRDCQRWEKIDKHEDATKQALNTTRFRRSAVVRTRSARTYLSGTICNEVRRGNNTNTVRSWLDNGGTAFSGLTATS